MSQIQESPSLSKQLFGGVPSSVGRGKSGWKRKDFENLANLNKIAALEESNRILAEQLEEQQRKLEEQLSALYHPEPSGKVKKRVYKKRVKVEEKISPELLAMIMDLNLELIRKPLQLLYGKSSIDFEGKSLNLDTLIKDMQQIQDNNKK